MKTNKQIDQEIEEFIESKIKSAMFVVLINSLFLMLGSVMYDEEWKVPLLCLHTGAIGFASGAIFVAYCIKRLRDKKNPI